jgi:hypothetical protein
VVMTDNQILHGGMSAITLSNRRTSLPE